MDRIDNRLRELQQELIETRNLTIKTDHAVRALAGDVRELTHGQEAFHKRTLWSSATAYVLFTVLAVGGLFLFFHAATARSKADAALIQGEIAQFKDRIHALEGRIDKEKSTEKQVWTFYQLLKDGSDEEVVARFPKVKAHMTNRTAMALLSREVEQRRQKLAEHAYAEGLHAYDNDNWAEARAAFERAANYRDLAPYNPALHFYLADSAYHLEKYTDAVRYYNMALASGSLSHALAPRATYRLAQALRALGRDREALAAYAAFTEQFPSHPWDDAASTHLKALKDKLNGTKR